MKWMIHWELLLCVFFFYLQVFWFREKRKEREQKQEQEMEMEKEKEKETKNEKENEKEKEKEITYSIRTQRTSSIITGISSSQQFKKARNWKFSKIETVS